MKYWLVYANAADGNIPIKIENRTIVYRGSNQFDRTIRLHAGGFHIKEARVAFAGNAEEFYETNASRKWEKLVSLGVTTAVFIVTVSISEDPIEKIEEALDHLTHAPIDFVLVPSVSCKTLTPSFIRRVLRHSIPAVEISFDSLENCEKVPWDWVKQAKGPSSLSFLFRFPPAETKTDRVKTDKWQKSLASTFPMMTLEDGVMLNKRDMRTLGIYPRKGTIARGDADYLLYYDDGNRKSKTSKDESFSYVDPDIVVCRGQIIKAGSVMNLKAGFGKCHNDILPGYFRSICDL